ncbi:MAG: hypothetical protein J6Y95_03760 [Lachnospiraceae bacterium]|nr:hypothetical protein [Lachnospiraceae bacterium]
MSRGTFFKVILGGIAAGAAAAVGYTYVKRYKEVLKEHEEKKAADRAAEGLEEEAQEEMAERKFSTIDMDVAKEAAVKTFESLKEGGKKAWGVAVDSGKAVSEIVNENYGESIQKAKEKVS